MRVVDKLRKYMSKCLINIAGGISGIEGVRTELDSEKKRSAHLEQVLGETEDRLKKRVDENVRLNGVVVERDNFRRMYWDSMGQYVELVGKIGAVEKTTEEIIGTEKEYRVQMLIAGLPDLGGDVVNNFGLKEKDLVIAMREERAERMKANERAEAIKVNHLKYVMKIICANENVRKVNAVVYRRGEILCSTDKFEKRFGSTYVLEKFLMKDERFSTDLEMGRRTNIKYEDENLTFVPDSKDKNLGISVGFFVPHRGKDIVEKFIRAGDRAAGIVHGALRAEKLDGLEFA